MFVLSVSTLQMLLVHHSPKHRGHSPDRLQALNQCTYAHPQKKDLARSNRCWTEIGSHRLGLNLWQKMSRIPEKMDLEPMVSHVYSTGIRNVIVV